MNSKLGQVIQNRIAADLNGAQANVQWEQFALEATPDDELTDEARLMAHSETFDFAALGVQEFALAHAPYVDGRQVWLRTESGRKIRLPERAVEWEENHLRLKLAAQRNLAGVKEIEVSYSYLAFFARLWLVQTLTVELKASGEPETSDAGDLERSQALVIALLELHRREILAEAVTDFTQGDYSVTIRPYGLKLLSGAAPDATHRLLTYQVESEYRCSRALEANEGALIKRIITADGEPSTDRPVAIDIEIDV